MELKILSNRSLVADDGTLLAGCGEVQTRIGHTTLSPWREIQGRS